MIYEYSPSGVCSQKMVFDIENGVVKSLKVLGGCNGNLKGISSLVEGLAVDEIIERLDGITCGPRPTSCPDQIANALKQFIKENG